jgi:prepilin-type N-terminal cleavage/methylation domain-containing protein
MRPQRDTHRLDTSTGFTLIELLVVIAIIAILSAALMPALSSATDRSRVTECRAHLAQLGMALQLYYHDWGTYPTGVDRVLAAGYVTNDLWLRCTKTGAFYYYVSPVIGSGPDALMASCVGPATPAGQRPHGYRNSFVSLSRGGKIAEQ